MRILLIAAEYGPNVLFCMQIGPSASFLVWRCGFGAGEGLVAEMRILLVAAEYGANVLLCVPNRTKCMLLGSVMPAAGQRPGFKIQCQGVESNRFRGPNSLLRVLDFAQPQLPQASKGKQKAVCARLSVPASAITLTAAPRHVLQHVHDKVWWHFRSLQLQRQAS
jgi:hypothetical protein